jgi:SAM-dependent methyltransferase
MSVEYPADVFFDLHSGLPREGPGDDESTLRALSLCSDLPPRPDILDVGCGPGMQTVALAQTTDGTVTAVDLHEPFLDQLRARAEEAGVRERINVMGADMTDLPFGRHSFDLVWSEGAAYIMGVSQALIAWSEFLRPCSYLAFSELTWLVPDPPDEVHDFFTAQYPGIRDIEGNLERIRAAGYDVVDHFTLPGESWWTHYQTPLEAKLPALREKYADDEVALRVIEETVEEHRIRREHANTYGYEFYVTRLCDPEAIRRAAKTAEDAEGARAGAEAPDVTGAEAAEPAGAAAGAGAVAPDVAGEAGSDPGGNESEGAASGRAGEYPPPLG